MSDAGDERACVDGGAVLERLTQALRTAGVPFTHTHHQAVFTSAEAAAVRGVSLHSGAKALIMKGAENFVLVVLPADMALDSGALRDFLGCKRLRFATREEVVQLTGLTPGSIPPFGSLFKLPTVCDPRLADNESINFNAGSHTDSFQMTFAEYVAYESPTLAAVAKATA
ncbi:MAG: hypothetical protein HY763_08000 [Planctomycetes bacterium]|nr:hypothetical protein [Planctomycetota bacterium]